VEIQKEDKSTIVTFTYDPFGRRLSKTVHRQEIDDDEDEAEDDEKESPRTTFYIYDNEDIILEYNERGQITARYTHGPGIDEPLAVEKKRDNYFYHADGLGSVVALTDSKQKVVENYDYDSFGNLKRHGHKVKQPYTYTSREFDEETGLYYYRARTYDPVIGRFLQPDPIGFDGGGMNLYAYVGNNPFGFVDPTGEFILGGLAGLGIELGLQLYKYNGDLNCIDWWDVGVATAVGAIAPGFVNVGRQTWISANAIKTFQSNFIVRVL
jgi:RHS repeat-associated protein